MRTYTTSWAYRLPVSLWMCLLFLLMGNVPSVAQQTIVLPSNGLNTQETCLQGGLRYQRQLYLITPAELEQSDLQNGMQIDAIGFTIGAAPDTSARGFLKLYLQNTSDIESRFDTNWTNVNVATNSLLLENLLKGDYEWQVQTVCSGNSPFSASAFFSNADLTGCNQPEDLMTTNISTSTATFNWYAIPSGSFSHYFIEYSRIDSVYWISDTTSANSYVVNGLLPGKLYQWKVQSVCANGSSALTGAFFQTNTPDVCNEPSALTVGIVTDNTAALSWTAAAGATRYDIQYRRRYTESWFSTISFTNTLNLGSLMHGTNYEWRVRTVCAGGSGSYVTGPDFMTTGVEVCYTPEGIRETNVSDTTATLQWTQADNVTSYNVRYRLRNSISWANAHGPMTLVHNDSVTIPENFGAWSFPFTGMQINTFTYTGGGIYVAWEYTNDSLPLSSFNNSLATIEGTSYPDVVGSDSSDIVLCLKSIGDTSHIATLTSDAFRPETSFGSPGLGDSVEIVVVHSLGYLAVPFGNPVINRAVLKNHSPIPHTYPVTLTVKNQEGVVRYTETVMANVDPNDTALVAFSEWSAPVLETDSMIVSVPVQTSESVVQNNWKYYLQKVNPMVLSYANDGSPVTSAGLGTEEGLILARHHVEGCSRITAASIFLTNSAADNEMYAVVLDQNGTILDTSAAYTPGVNETGNWHSFFFSDPPELNNEDFYIGIAQTAGMNAYHPVGVQWETPYIRDSAYFRADIDGSNLIHHPTPGRLMIRSHISHAMPSPVIEGDLTLCENDTNTLSVASLDLRYATSVTGVSSEYSAIQYSASQALGSPDVFPGSGGDPKAWASSTLDGQREYLELGFVDAGPVNRIVIYETYNPGAVDSVFVRNPLSGNFELVYSATAESLGIPSNALTIDFPMTAFDVSEIRIALNSPAVSGFNSIDAVGIGQYDDSPGYASYLWGPNGETTSSIQVSAPGSYSVVVTDNNGCGANTSVDVITPDGTIPVITAESETDFCEGGFVILTSDQSAGNVWSTGETTQQISVDESGSYYVSYDDGTGCGLVNSNTIEVTVHPLPVVSINGILAICPGGTTTLDAGTYSEYLWSTSATTQTIEVSAIGSYSVTVTDANGCTGFASVNVVDAPELEPEISGNQTFCLGSSTLLDAGEYETYLWNTGAITQTITVTIPGVYSVTVEDSNGCSGDADITTFGLEPPAPSISGDAGFCPGGEATLDAGPGFVTYAWSQGSANQMITVDAASSYSVTVTDGNGCSGEDAQMVVEFTPPQPVIAGTLSFCAGSTTQLDAGHGYASYLWSTGEITQTIVVDTTDTFSVTVTDNNGCTGEDSATTTNEGAIPESPGPISGPTSGLCGSENVEYSILPVENAAFYVWTIPENATIVSGQGTTTIIVDFDTDFTSGDIVVAASNACGQSPSIDPTFITVSGVPETPDEITGPDSNVCPGDIVEYSVVEVPFATEYSWTVPMNAQITSGQNTPSITVEILNGFSGGDVCVAAGNTCGESMPLCITIINGDMDDDGIPDCLDNCPEVFNPNQKDKDHDGVGDACDPCNNNHQGGSCDDGDPCTINDELDAFCVCQGTYVDSDNDGICDAFDICPGFDDEIDSDGDGVPDGCDECPGYDDNLDENGNGIPDDCDFCTTVDVDAGDCEFVYYGYMPLACTMLEASATSGTAPFTYLWSNGSTSQTPNVCPATTTVYTVTVTDANGCTGTDDVTVEAIDVRCGPGNKNVELCHFNSSDNTYTTICVKANQVPSHLNHGDELGECGITPCSGGMAYMGNSLHHDPDTWESSGFLNATNNSKDHTGSLQVYPNPARNEISITGLVYNLVPPRSRIIDMQGRSSIVELVPASNSSIWKLDVSLLNDGVYILEVLQDGTRHHVRLVITR